MIEPPINSPCFKCQERKVGCHATCDKYADYEKELIKYRKWRYETNLANALFVEDVVKRRNKKRR